MNTKLLMTASALFMGVLGLAATFAPQEVVAYTGSSATGALPLFIQLAGALYVGFAMVDWMAKDSLVGGIYARPISVGNLVHFVVGALALIKGASTAGGTTALYALAAVYALFALAFGLIVFGSPVKAAGE